MSNFNLTHFRTEYVQKYINKMVGPTQARGKRIQRSAWARVRFILLDSSCVRLKLHYSRAQKFRPDILSTKNWSPRLTRPEKKKRCLPQPGPNLPKKVRPESGLEREKNRSDPGPSVQTSVHSKRVLLQHTGHL